jgi:DNA polymerase-3 subunit epsilon
MFNLKKDLIFIDIEATGLHVTRDRIIQIGMIKYLANSDQTETYNELINPGIPISEEAMEVHGITPKMLKNKPGFRHKAKEVFEFIGNGDLAGYNLNRFDIPILMEELDRCGFDFELGRRNIIDVQRIFYKMEPRNLNAAYKFYCGKKLENAHDAMADVRATADILAGQLKYYKDQNLELDDGEIIENPIKNDMKELHQFTNDLKLVDVTQRMKFDNDGEIIFNFGKYLGQPVAKTLVEDPQYYNWILNKEFSVQVKKIVTRLVKEYKQSSNKE